MKLTLDQQQYLDRSLAMASVRRDKVLRMIMDYRGSDFAKQLRETVRRDHQGTARCRQPLPMAAMPSRRRRPEMASERQIAANRRNAAKSTGPRSAAGKQRAGGNAVRHGLFSLATRRSALEEIEALAHRLPARAPVIFPLAHARSAAEADIEVKRARRVRLALIERVESFSSLEARGSFRPTPAGMVRWLIKMDTWGTTRRGRRPNRRAGRPLGIDADIGARAHLGGDAESAARTGEAHGLRTPRRRTARPGDPAARRIEVMVWVRRRRGELSLIRPGGAAQRMGQIRTGSKPKFAGNAS